MALAPNGPKATKDDAKAAHYREASTPGLADDQQNAPEYPRVVDGLRDGSVGTLEEPREHHSERLPFAAQVTTGDKSRLPRPAVDWRHSVGLEHAPSSRRVATPQSHEIHDGGQTKQYARVEEDQL